MVTALNSKFTELQKTLINTNKEQSHIEYFKWLDFDYLKEINEKSIKLASEIKSSNYKQALVMGMGGSGINSLVLKNALYEFNPNKAENSLNLIIQSNLDPSSFKTKLKELNLNETVFVIISKSGNTDEVKRSLAMLLEQIDLKQFAQQAVIITEPKSAKNNFLHSLKEEVKEKTNIEIKFLENHPEIGGRFSMFSPVGMFSAELMSLNSKELLSGAEEIWQEFSEASNIEASKAAQAAIKDIEFSRDGFYAKYSMVYSDSLEALNKFRAQLKGESLNKNGIESLIHISGIGTSNHHSDLELLFKDDNKIVFEQVFFEKPFTEGNLSPVKLDCLKKLEGSSQHSSLLKNHINPLADYLKTKKHPVIQSPIKEQNEKSLGAFLMTDMLGTIVQAALQDSENSNDKLDLAIRQWEVEKYKQSVNS